MMFRTKITGIREVDDVLTRITPRHAKNILRATVHDVAGQLAKDAREKAPRSDGAPTKGKAHLADRATIKHRRDRQTRGSTVISSSVRVFGFWRFFWKMQEHGTRNNPEHAMFMKAVEAMRGQLRPVFIASFQKKLAAAVNRELKKRAK